MRQALLPFLPEALEPARLRLRIGASLIDSAIVRMIFTGIWAALLLANMPGIEGSAMSSDLLSWRSTLVLGLSSILYYGLSEARSGQSLGKRLLGLRVTTENRLTASPFQVIGRVMIVLVADGADFFEDPFYFPIAAGLYGVLFSTMRRRNGFRGLHEFATGTRTVQLRRTDRNKIRGFDIPKEHLPFPPELPRELGSYRLYGQLAAIPSGVLVLAKDSRLGRDVWLRLLDEELPATPEPEAKEPRTDEVRFIGRETAENRTFDVFESPGGCSLEVFLDQRAPLPWHQALPVLQQLTELYSNGGSLVSPERIWIDQNGALRVLSFPLSAKTDSSGSTGGLGSTAKHLLFGSGAGHFILPPDLPFHAEPVVAELLRESDSTDVGHIGRQLSELGGKPPAVRLRARAVHASIVLSVGAVFSSAGVIGGFELVFADEAAEVLAHGVEIESGPSDISLDRDALLLVYSAIASYCSPESVESVLATDHPDVSAVQAMALHEEATARFGATQRTNVMAALGRLSEHDPWFGEKAEEWSTSMSEDLSHPGAGLIAQGVTIAFLLCGVLFMLIGATVAFVFRGGLLHAFVGTGLRNRNGEPAGRLRCAVRSGVIFVPVVIAALLALPAFNAPPRVLWTVLLASAALPYGLHLRTVFANPTDGLFDQLVRVRTVPR